MKLKTTKHYWSHCMEKNEGNFQPIQCLKYAEQYREQCNKHLVTTPRYSNITLLIYLLQIPFLHFFPKEKNKYFSYPRDKHYPPIDGSVALVIIFVLQWHRERKPKISQQMFSIVHIHDIRAYTCFYNFLLFHSIFICFRNSSIILCINIQSYI